jgi:hypothetical protein
MKKTSGVQLLVEIGWRIWWHRVVLLGFRV